MRNRYGRYEVLRALGEGAMAAVHLARDPLLTRPVAVKVLHREVARSRVALKRFFNEAKTVANVRNPHVVEVFDFGREGRDYYLVMEFVDGPSLQGLVRQPADPGAPLPDLVTAALLCQAAEGLDIAARHGVVHRDLKPENLMVNTQGYLKVADFGIAHLQDETLTRTGAVLGSPMYMSPEQVRGIKPITSQSDMFSLGAVLYRCLAGVPPFAAPSLKDLYRSIAREPHVPLLRARPGLDPDLARVGEILLAKDPAARGDGPRWLRAELRTWLMRRGVADPMDLVAAHLRGLADRGAADPGSGGSGSGAIPRTVAATRPAASRSGARPPATRPVDPTHGPSAPGTEPLTRAVRSRSGRGRAVPAGALAVLLLAAAGYGVYRVRTSRAIPPGTEAVPAGPGDPAPAGDGGKDARPGPGKDPGRGREAEAGDLPGAEPAPHPGGTGSAEAEGGVRLRIVSSPPFAEAFLDGRSMGVTPLDLADVPAGLRRLTLRSPGGATLDTLLRLAPGRRTVRARLGPGAVALDAEE